MAKSPESRLIDRIHRQLIKYVDSNNSPCIFKQKMNMMPGGITGIPDYYYEGDRSILWVEYKAIDTWNNKRKIPTNKITPNQINWLQRAVNNNVNCAVIIGDSKGQCLILDNNEIFNDKITIKNMDLHTPQSTAYHIATLLLYSLILK